MFPLGRYFPCVGLHWSSLRKLRLHHRRRVIVFLVFAHFMLVFTFVQQKPRENKLEKLTEALWFCASIFQVGRIRFDKAEMSFLGFLLAFVYCAQCSMACV